MKENARLKGIAKDSLPGNRNVSPARRAMPCTSLPDRFLYGNNRVTEKGEFL